MPTPETSRLRQSLRKHAVVVAFALAGTAAAAQSFNPLPTSVAGNLGTLTGGALGTWALGGNADTSGLENAAGELVANSINSAIMGVTNPRPSSTQGIASISSHPIAIPADDPMGVFLCALLQGTLDEFAREKMNDLIPTSTPMDVAMTDAAGNTVASPYGAALELAKKVENRSSDEYKNRSLYDTAPSVAVYSSAGGPFDAFMNNLLDALMQTALAELDRQINKQLNNATTYVNQKWGGLMGRYGGFTRTALQPVTNVLTSTVANASTAISTSATGAISGAANATTNFYKQ